MTRLSLRHPAAVGFVLALSACAPSTPDPVHAPVRHKLVQAFALYHADDAHDLTESVDAASLRDGIRAEPGFFAADDPDALRSFARSLRVPPGDAVLIGATPQAAARTYLVHAAPALGDAVVASAMPATRKGAAGIVLTFTPDGYERLYAALAQKSSAVLLVQGFVEPGALELLDDGNRAKDEGQPPPACVARSAFLPLAPRNAQTAESRAKELAATLPPAPSECQAAWPE